MHNKRKEEQDTFLPTHCLCNEWGILHQLNEKIFRKHIKKIPSPLLVIYCRKYPFDVPYCFNMINGKIYDLSKVSKETILRKTRQEMELTDKNAIIHSFASFDDFIIGEKISIKQIMKDS